MLAQNALLVGTLVCDYNRKEKFDNQEIRSCFTRFTTDEIRAVEAGDELWVPWDNGSVGGNLVKGHIKVRVFRAERSAFFPSDDEKHFGYEADCVTSANTERHVHSLAGSLAECGARDVFYKADEVALEKILSRLSLVPA